MAIVGGAVIPPLTGHLADATGSLSIALALPMACYATICGYGLFARKPLIAAV
jgi:FHS family L-fucose permease-like MFS transporter